MSEANKGQISLLKSVEQGKDRVNEEFQREMVETEGYNKNSNLLKSLLEFFYLALCDSHN